MNKIDLSARRPIGVDGKPVSPIGLGTVKFGRDTNVKYPKGFNIPSDSELEALLNLAFDLGINLIDTAPAYGNSESRIGKLLKSKRQHCFLASKVGEYYDNEKSHYDFSAKATIQSVENSLTNLKTDYLDLVSIHSNGDDEAILEQSDILATLETLKKEGKIINIGMSSKTIDGGIKALSFVDILMVELNHADQSQAPVIKKAIELNKSILIKKALASGHAQNTAAAINFAANYEGVSSIILGTINPEHLMQNIRDFKPK